MWRKRWGCVLLAAACTASSDRDEPSSGGLSGQDGTNGDTSSATTDSGTSGASTSANPSEPTTDPTTDPTSPSGTTEGGSEDSGESSSTTEAPTIWVPAPGTSWQWQLVGDVDTSFDVQVYDVDLFDVPTTMIDSLHGQGRIVICYFSAGSYEEWRDDAGAFPADAIGNPLDGWPGEAWLDVRSAAIREIMGARLDLAVQKNCDAVEPDNVDGYTNGTGFDLVGNDQLDYNRWLAEQAHARGLSIGLKNDVDQVDALVDYFDWALNEECLSYDECETTVPFIEQGKAVFHVEYVDDASQGNGLAGSVCPQTSPLGFSTLIKEWDLTPWRLACE